MGGKAGYTQEADPEKTAKAIGRELPISPKHAREICKAIKGMSLEDAKKYLEDVITKKRAIPFKRYNSSVGHRKGKGFGPGRYPKKSAQAILKTINHAEANAEYGGLDTENMYIKHIAAHPGRTWEGYMPRAHGRWTQKNQQTVNIEVILEVRGD